MKKSLLMVVVVLILGLSMITGCSGLAGRMDSLSGPMDPNENDVKIPAEFDVKLTDSSNARYWLYWLHPEVWENCFVEGTTVLTPEADTVISSLKEGDYVVGIDQNSLFDIKETYLNDYSGEVYKVTVGDKEVTVTPPHPFIVFDGYNVTVKRAANVTKDMWLYTESGWYHPSFEVSDYEGKVYNLYLWDEADRNLSVEVLKCRSFFGNGIASADLSAQEGLIDE